MSAPTAISSPTLFDAYVMVDWSANGTPKAGKDSIWIAEAVRDRGRVIVGRPRNPPTRAAACALIRASLVAHVDAGRRVLIGFDFVYAFPRGFADALGLAGPDARWLRVWRALAERVRDDATNANNRWDVAAALNRRLGATPGPFWNCPGRAATAELGMTKGRFPYVAGDGVCLAEYRIADATVRRSKPTLQSVWKLYTTGSVGSQTLLGIPRLHALRTDPRLARWSRVWPFETGFTADPSPRAGPFVLHAEMWPRLVELASGRRVLDARQVLSVVHAFAAFDAAGKLGAMFDRPPTLTDDEVRVCCDEEGWIVGA